MKNITKLEHIAKKNGYINMLDMLVGYGMFPIVGQVLKRDISTSKIDKIARNSGYTNAFDMLCDCGIVPSVRKTYKDLCYNKPKFKLLLLKDFIECIKKRS